MQKIKTTRFKHGRIRRSFKSFAFATMLAVATILPNYAKSESKKQPTTQPGGSFRAGMAHHYKKGQDERIFGILGASVKLSRTVLRVPLSLIINTDISFGAEGDLKIYNLTASLNIPVNNWFAFEPMLYRSEFHGNVPFGAGAIFHIPELNIHAAPHVFKLNDSAALSFPVFWTPKLGPLNFLFKLIAITNHSALPKPAPLIGGEVGLTIEIIKAIDVYGKAFAMTLRAPNGDLFIGPANVQVGTQINF